MNRRTLLTAIGAGTTSATGCLSRLAPTGGDAGDPADDLPEDCPTTQDLGVKRPTALDADAAVAFVEAYERAYYREVVVDYEPESDLAEYELSGSVDGTPEPSGDGWELSYSGGGGIYRPTLSMEASTAEPPAAADVVPIGEIEDQTLVDLLEEAARAGEASHHVAPPGEAVDGYVDLLASLSTDFEHLSGKGDSDELYVDVDGTTVELRATATSFHGDYGWTVRYYVDEHVVRRTAEEGTDPRDGTLLECRTST